MLFAVPGALPDLAKYQDQMTLRKKLVDDISWPMKKALRCIHKIRHLRVVDSRELHVLHEREHLRRLLQYLQVDCVLDVGANAGQYARMAIEHYFKDYFAKKAQARKDSSG